MNDLCLDHVALYVDDLDEGVAGRSPGTTSSRTPDPNLSTDTAGPLSCGTARS
jgi:hypothetical protein